MKLLYLLRHAKSAWDDPNLRDHDRPLTARGRRAAHTLAGHFRRAGITPALVLCSTARRATETFDGIRPALEPVPEVHLEENLYGASTEDLVHRVHEIPSLVPSVLLIGHNPGIHSAALVFAGDEESELVARLRDKMATGALATFEVDSEWSAAGPETARLVSFVAPRDLE